MSDKVQLVIHHGGKLEDMEQQLCVGGNIEEVEMTVDYLSCYQLMYIARNLGYKNSCQMWFKIGDLSGVEGIEEIVSDKNIKEFVECKVGYGPTHIYFVEIVPLMTFIEGDADDCIIVEAPCEMENSKGDEDEDSLINDEPVIAENQRGEDEDSLINDEPVIAENQRGEDEDSLINAEPVIGQNQMGEDEGSRMNVEAAIGEN